MLRNLPEFRGAQKHKFLTHPKIEGYSHRFFELKGIYSYLIPHSLLCGGSFENIKKQKSKSLAILNYYGKIAQDYVRPEPLRADLFFSILSR